MSLCATKRVVAYCGGAETDPGANFQVSDQRVTGCSVETSSPSYSVVETGGRGQTNSLLCGTFYSS